MDQISAFDCDGTLVDVSSIRHLVAKGLKDRNFDEFHRSSVDCHPIDMVVKAAQLWAEAGVPVFQVTARQEKYRSLTSFWLADHKVPSDKLIMRTDGDQRSDADVKREMITQLLKDYDIMIAYDDNPSIWAVWAEFDIACIRVPGWSDV